MFVKTRRDVPGFEALLGLEMTYLVQVAWLRLREKRKGKRYRIIINK
jgi:hypothetical protein